MLVVASGLLVQSLSNLQKTPLGFDPVNVATLEVKPPSLRYESGEALSALMSEVVLEMETIPGVSDVSAASDLPFPGNPSCNPPPPPGN